MKIFKIIIGFFKRLFTFSFKVKCNTSLTFGSENETEEKTDSEDN